MFAAGICEYDEYPEMRWVRAASSGTSWRMRLPSERDPILRCCYAARRMTKGVASVKTAVVEQLRWVVSRAIRMARLNHRFGLCVGLQNERCG